MGPGTRCFKDQLVQLQTYQEHFFNDKSAILLHPKLDEIKILHHRVKNMRKRCGVRR